MGEKEVNETIMPMNVIKRYKCSRESKDSTETNYKRNVALASVAQLLEPRFKEEQHYPRKH